MLKLREAVKILKKSGCVKLANGSHEKWQRPDGHTFALPLNKKELSPGVERKFWYFIEGNENYFRR